MATFGENIQPFLLLIVGAVLTGIIFPRITKGWQDNKAKNEVRISLIQEMSETAAYGIAKILTAIARYRDIERIGGELNTFTPNQGDELYKEFETWLTKTYTLAAKLRAYFPTDRMDVSSDVDMMWASYFGLIMNVWELATKLYFSGATRDQIADYLNGAMGVRLQRTEIIQKIDRSRIENRDINELQTLSDELLGYGHVFFANLDFSKIKISEKSPTSRWSWFRSRRPPQQRERQQQGQQSSSQQ